MISHIYKTIHFSLKYIVSLEILQIFLSYLLAIFIVHDRNQSIFIQVFLALCPYAPPTHPPIPPCFQLLQLSIVPSLCICTFSLSTHIYWHQGWLSDLIIKNNATVQKCKYFWGILKSGEARSTDRSLCRFLINFHMYIPIMFG